MDTGKVTTNTEMTTIRASTTTGTMTATFAGGMATIKAIFHQDSPRKTGCRQGWKNSLCDAASFRRVFRNACNRVQRIWNGGYLRPLRIARTS